MKPVAERSRRRRRSWVLSLGPIFIVKVAQGRTPGRPNHGLDWERGVLAPSSA